MAIWQFQFSLVPEMGIVEHYGGLVEVLPEYAARHPDAPLRKESEFHDYWKGRRVPSASLRALETLLPTATSWSKDAQMFGDSESDHIEVWDDDIVCSIDVRSVNLALLASIVEIATTLGCMIVLKNGGRVLPPDLDQIVAEINASAAMKFVQDPGQFLESHARGEDD